MPQFWEEHSTIILRHMHPSHGNSTYYRNLKKKRWPAGWQVNVVPLNKSMVFEMSRHGMLSFQCAGTYSILS